MLTFYLIEKIVWTPKVSIFLDQFTIKNIHYTSVDLWWDLNGLMPFCGMKQSYIRSISWEDFQNEEQRTVALFYTVTGNAASLSEHLLRSTSMQL